MAAVEAQDALTSANPINVNILQEKDKIAIESDNLSQRILRAEASYEDLIQKRDSLEDLRASLITADSILTAKKKFLIQQQKLNLQEIERQTKLINQLADEKLDRLKAQLSLDEEILDQQKEIQKLLLEQKEDQNKASQKEKKLIQKSNKALEKAILKNQSINEEIYKEIIREQELQRELENSETYNEDLRRQLGL